MHTCSSSAVFPSTNSKYFDSMMKHMIPFIRWRATSPIRGHSVFIILSFDGKFYRITIIAMARTQAGIAT